MKQSAVTVDAKQREEFLACLKEGGSLAARVAKCFKAIFDPWFEESDSDNQFGVAQEVKARLHLIATDAGYDSDYVERILGECLKANGLVKPTKTPRTGRKTEVIPERAYKAAVAAYDVLAGHGTLPSPKVIRQVSAILSQLAKEETTIADVKAYRAPVVMPATTAAETASKVVKMPIPQPVKKAA